MALVEYTPAYINTTENKVLKSVVTPEHWNELFNLLIAQGNNSATALYNILVALAATTAADQIGTAAITGVTGTTVQDMFASVKALIDLCYTSSAVDTLLAQKETVADANQLVKSVTFNSADGKFTITKQDGTTSVIDTALEKVAINFSYDQDTQSLILTLVDGGTVTIPLSALIQENDFLDSATIDFSVTDHVVTATIKNGSITEAMLTGATLAALVGYKNSAETAATNAAASEANALTYKNNAATSAGEALVSKNNAKVSEDNAKLAETNAKTSETNAETAEANATAKATLSQSYAIGGTGTRAGEDTDNAKYYKEQAAEIVGGDYPTKAEAQGYVSTHDSSGTAHATLFGGKVDKVAGKRLSTEDYTTAEKTKLAGIATGAEVNVNADWNASSGDAQILNKPTTMTPSAHKSTHATGQADALSPSAIGAATKISGTATLATASWTGAAAPYTYTLAVSGMLATDVPTIDYVGGTDQAAAELIKTAWQLAAGSYTKPQTAAGQIIFKAKEKPVTNIPVYWEVVR